MSDSCTENCVKLPVKLCFDLNELPAGAGCNCGIATTEEPGLAPRLATDDEVKTATGNGLVSAEQLAALPMRYVLFNTVGSHTYTKPANLKAVFVEMVGGGGGSAGLKTGTGYACAGGSGGGYCRKLILSDDLLENTTVTVAAGGSAGASNGGAGGTGGTSSFGTHCSATGGAGSTLLDQRSYGSPYGSVNGPTPGIGVGGDINACGGRGRPSYYLNGGCGVYGEGGSSYFSGSTRSANLGTGTGGGGAYTVLASVARAGTAGDSGTVIIYEFF